MGFELTGATPDERLKELTEKLEQGVSEIFTSGRYAEYLSAMSKFHTYSFGDRKSTRLNSSHYQQSRMPSSA